VSLIPVLLLATAALAAEPLAIQDNSFFIEEAYNQEANVVQHIFTYQRDRDGSFSPRLSYLVHDHAAQFNLPVSIVLSPRVVTHWNAGATVSRHEHSWSGGGSVIVAALPKMHLMLEVLRQPDATLVSPGIRWAHDLPHQLQIVPGIAMPVDTRTHDRSLFLYLSFEHPFR